MSAIQLLGLNACEPFSQLLFGFAEWTQIKTEKIGCFQVHLFRHWILSQICIQLRKYQINTDKLFGVFLVQVNSFGS